MKSILVLEEVLSQVNNTRNNVFEKYWSLDEEYNQSIDRKERMHLQKRKNEEKIKLETIDSILRKINKIK